MEAWLLATFRKGKMKHHEAMVTIAARIPAAHAEAIRQHCGQNHQMMSDGIRLAVQLYVEQLQKRETNDQ